MGKDHGCPIADPVHKRDGHKIYQKLHGKVDGYQKGDFRKRNLVAALKGQKQERSKIIDDSLNNVTHKAGDYCLVIILFHRNPLRKNVAATIIQALSECKEESEQKACVIEKQLAIRRKIMQYYRQNRSGKEDESRMKGYQPKDENSGEDSENLKKKSTRVPNEKRPENNKLVNTDVDLLTKNIPRLSMSELLDAYDLKSLKGIAQRLSLPGYTNMRKASLVRELSILLLEPVIIRKDFYFLDDKDLQFFEEANSSDEGFYPISQEQKDTFLKLAYFGYAFFTRGQMRVRIPKELKEIYPLANSEAFREKRSKIQWIMKIMNEIVPIYYGVIPLQQFSRLCRRKDSPALKPEEVPTLAKQIPDRYTGSSVEGDFVVSDYYRLHEKDKKELLALQGEKPFYIMRQKELEELIAYGYPVKEFWHNRLKALLMGQWKTSEKEAELILAEIHREVALGGRVQDIIDFLKDFDLKKNELNDYMQLFQNIINNSPCMINRGYTPDMLAGK